jgi:hypothetical protein
VVAATSERAGDCGAADLAEVEALDEALYGGGGGVEATFLLHPLKAPHSTVTANPAQIRDLMKNPPMSKDTRIIGL